MSNWAGAGIGFGFLFAIFSAIRYLLLFPDTDKAIVYAIIGILIMCVSWNYNVNIAQDNSIRAIEDYISDKNDEEREKQEIEPQKVTD